MTEEQEWLQDVFYEVWQLYTAYAHVAVRRDSGTAAQHNAWLESCLIHVRVLNEFFSVPPGRKRKKYPMDLHACDFEELKDDADPDVRLVPTEIIDRIGAHLAHLSKKRTPYRTQPDRWNLPTIVPPVLMEGASFLSRHVDKFPDAPPTEQYAYRRGVEGVTRRGREGTRVANTRLTKDRPLPGGEKGAISPASDDHLRNLG